MNKQTYRQYRANARANGAAHALRTHGLDMYDRGLMLELEKQDADLLRMRQLWFARPAGDNCKTIIRCTSIVTR